MGSFDYNDDYSSFDNLLDRATLLTEGGRGLGGYHSGLGGALTSRLKDAGSEAFTRDARLFAVHILFGASIITDEEESLLRSAGPAAGKNYRLALVQILDNHKDEIIERADEISDAIEERFPAFTNEILGRDPERIKSNISNRQVKLATKDIEREIKSGKDLDDSISDNVEKVLANAAVYTTLTNTQGRVDDKDLDTVEKYATEFVNGFNDLDVLIKKLKTFDTENFNVLADELSNSLSSIKSNAGIGEDNEDPYRGVNDPGDSDNSYEGGMAGQNISEIEDEEDQAKEGHLVFLLRFKGTKSERPWPYLIDTHGKRTALMHKDDSSFNHSSLRPFHRKYVSVSGNPDPEFRGTEDQLLVTDVTEAPDPFAGISAREDKEEVISREGLNNNMRKRKLLFEKRKNWNRFRSENKEKLVVEKDLNAAERRALPDKDFALPGKGKGPEGKQAGSYPIPDEKHARSALSLVSQHGTPEEKKKVRAAVARKFPGINQEDEEDSYDPQKHGAPGDLNRKDIQRQTEADQRGMAALAASSDPDHRDKDKALSKASNLAWEEVGRVNKERDAAYKAYQDAVSEDQPKLVASKYRMDKGRPGHDVYYDEAEDRNKVIPEPWRNPKPGAPRARLSNRLDFENEEEAEKYRHSPMLDSYRTSTSGYLTEQVAKDKRNKIKPKTENQSFKNRYKPKTHWQLEELKRYGL